MCFRVAIPFALPLVISETFCVLCHCHNLVLIAFGFSHSDRCEMVSQCAFNLNIFITANKLNLPNAGGTRETGVIQKVARKTQEMTFDCAVVQSWNCQIKQNND